ncbi:MBL fold metallo-hydrolase [Paenibacillus koleovorans]|uniref:MBL fold metallo-hydrolase n=1 Tax=Paenibacillus koleovorans TaxID=121608 RepID=UPI000FD7302D|nr:MBL fold metallo-hydrolase [Paenibacillus koleovorans]
MTRTIRTEWQPGLHQIKVPLPFPLRWVNSYLLEGTDGWTVIDPGLHTPESVGLWEETLAEMEIEFNEIVQIVLTHHHPDHYGLSGLFQERSGGAPVYISSTGASQISQLWGDGMPMSDRLMAVFLLHGLDRQLTEPMREHMGSFIPQVSPQPVLTSIEADVSLLIAGREYRPIHTPGHADGHLSFYDEVRRELICGDHVLPQITPNVGYLPGFDPNPLRTYLRSLDEAASLQVGRAYPGHRDPFTTYAERAEEIVLHHEERLLQMRTLLQERPLSAYALCRELFGDRLSVHQLRFALSETIAHVIYMQEEEQIREKQAEDGTLLYEALQTNRSVF